MIKQTKEHESVLNTDRFERRRFMQLLNQSKNMVEIVKSGNEEFPSFTPLMNDIWASFYKMNPKLKKTDEVDPAYQMNHELMNTIMNHVEFSKFRKTTRLDDLSSALGTMRYGEQVNKWIQEQKEENEDLQRSMDEANEIQDDLQQTQEQLKQAMETDSEHDKDKVKGAEEKVQQLQQELNELMQQANQQMGQQLAKNTRSLSQGIEVAYEETQQAKEEVKSLLGGGSGSGDAELQKVPLRNQIELAELLRDNKSIREIAKWAGRFKEIAKQKQKSKHDQSLDRSGITIGDDIESLLPQELAYLSNPKTKMDFLRRFAEKQTMIYDSKGKEELGKGPVILCLDQSGSMSDLDAQAKGFALALAMIAKKQRRDFCIILFSSARLQEKFIFKKGNISTQEIVSLVETFLSGGTHFEKPLKMAVDTISNNKRFKNGDIIFVTDGDPADSYAVERYMPEYHQIKKEKEFNTMSILLGSVNQMYVEPFSDKIIHASSFLDDVATDAFTI